ncbi:proline--tRNA ligase, chloroplastic/mitochondrial-like [Abrus precatorius]|uniref:proline--tRNA ligase n=1 Tax=Abrus precatorius TaxID=3816 RepID=A0A8B8LLI2_ABRPR|nr:proline--tRNA ligase, chloroplastic/mitochondrial-like [Abrus precatorius]
MGLSPEQGVQVSGNVSLLKETVGNYQVETTLPASLEVETFVVVFAAVLAYRVATKKEENLPQVPIWKKDDEKVASLNAATSVKEVLQRSGSKVKLDDSDQRTPGGKFNFWEMKGVLRIEIGPRDVSSGSVVISMRDIPGKQGKVFGISMDPSNLEAYVKDKLNVIQSIFSFGKGNAFRDSNIVDVSTYDDLKVAISLGKWARGPWSTSHEDELKVKEQTGATIRCFPFEQPPRIKRCLMTGDPAEEVAIFAKSY